MNDIKIVIINWDRRLPILESVRKSMLYVMVHHETQEGNKGPDVFNLKGMQLEEKLAYLANNPRMRAVFGNGIPDVRRFYTDPDYSRRIYQEYMTKVKPRLY